MGVSRTFEKLLFQLSLGDLDLHSPVNLLLVAAFVVGVVLDGGREQGVDESRLSQSRLSRDLPASLSAPQQVLERYDSKDTP